MPPLNILSEKSIEIFSGQSVYRTCDSMRIIRTEAGIVMDMEESALIKCTNLRKYIVTTMQVNDHLQSFGSKYRPIEVWYDFCTAQ